MLLLSGLATSADVPSPALPGTACHQGPVAGRCRPRSSWRELSLIGTVQSSMLFPSAAKSGLPTAAERVELTPLRCCVAALRCVALLCCWSAVVTCVYWFDPHSPVYGPRCPHHHQHHHHSTQPGYTTRVVCFHILGPRPPVVPRISQTSSSTQKMKPSRPKGP